MTATSGPYLPSDLRSLPQSPGILPPVQPHSMTPPRDPSTRSNSPHYRHPGTLPLRPTKPHNPQDPPPRTTSPDDHHLGTLPPVRSHPMIPTSGVTPITPGPSPLPTSTDLTH
ncbi:hypothetical protein DPMN_102354 [Dreissena polymorpha]|uniref:Uncharacterized protein n=1 Tax=Dreissena polymorpha TaxID=45954 RepID=A0A9D4RAA3_DREPO|nr:hypothetical protein DPMN_102087 [Dreissena polymorpha]KAH3859537.1 hypothetical protein DPMN_102354 [Dreissena polymorpha]